MKRLTYRKGNKTYAAKSTRTMCFCDRPLEERIFCIHCHYGKQDRTNCGPLAIIDRLADYEDTGLEPEEIMGLCSMHERAKMAQLLREEENKPLTLEKLREMDGEPVWTVTLGAENSGRWELCSCEVVTACPLYKVLRCVTVAGEATDYELDTYGKTWLAYRRKPESAQRREKR